MGTQSSGDVTEEHLQAAWRALRRPNWPATLAETLQDRARASLLRGYARTLARRGLARPAATPAPRAATALPPYHAPAPGWVDHKRAAAGDRDDD